MAYEKTQQIEERFHKAITLLSEKPHGVKQLASLLGVSPSTIRRIIVALNRRGYIIKSMRDDEGWRYVLMDSEVFSGRVLRGRKRIK